MRTYGGKTSDCMSVTNSAFLLATVAMPIIFIDSAYSIHNACTLCFLHAHAHN